MLGIISKRIIFVVLVAIILAPRAFAFAGIEINEIMYDLKTGSDDGREWVEIYNNSNSSADLSTYKFFEGDTNHKMVLKQGTASVAAGGYALVVSDFSKFKTDYPNFSGTIFDSTFSLNNTGETIALKNNDVVVDQLAYTSSEGGAGDGNSLQKINTVWQGAAPTPGSENKITPIPLAPVSITKTQPTQAKTSKVSALPGLPKGDLANERVSPPDPGPVNEETGNQFNYFYPIIFLIFVALSSAGVFFIRKSKSKPVPGDDFDLLEE